MTDSPAACCVGGARLARFFAVVALAFISPQWAAGQSSANYAIPQSTFNAGVGDTASASFHLSSSLGDSFFTGPSSSTNFQLTHGLLGGGSVTGSPPVLASAVSRKVHGSAGTFDLPLSLVTPPTINHNPTTEPRQGPAQTIVFTFDKPIASATATITEGTATAGAPTFSGNDVIVGLTGVNNKQYVTIALTNVSSVDGGSGGSGNVRVGFLLGDVNQNRVVTVSDLVLVNAQIAHLVTSANFLKDVNANGILTVSDKVIVNNNVAKALPAP